jgi:phage/plasmid-like protein (TIGR03299 family)
MPAYFDCGFSVREPMWHGEGLVLDTWPADWPEARTLAGLEWEPQPEPVFTKRLLTAAQIDALSSEDEVIDYYVLTGADVVATADPDREFPVMVTAEGHQAITRSDTGEVLGVPTGAYSAITHEQMGEIIEAVLEADSNVKFETAGSCRDGRQVWALARLDEPYSVPGDDSAIYPFLALTNSHDGSAACKLVYTDVRVVCWNTWNAASEQGERHGAQHVFRHTGNTAERIAEAKATLAQLREDSKQTRLLFEHLAQQPVDAHQVKTFEELFLPSPRDVGEQCTDRVHNNVVRARGTWRSLYEGAITTEGIRGNAYGLLQSATEYLDHVRSFRTRDTYMGRTLLRPEGLKAKALGLVNDVLVDA